MRSLLPWEYDDAVLRQMAAAGWSARKIGKMLGRTRNAVIGRCYREMIPLRGGLGWAGEVIDGS